MMMVVKNGSVPDFVLMNGTMQKTKLKNNKGRKKRNFESKDELTGG
jgi:hypothetical protein